MDLRPSFESAQAAFGVSATVTPPGGAPVSAVVVWLPPTTVEVPTGRDMTRIEARRVLALPLDVVPQVPRLTVIVAPEVEGQANQTWIAEESDRVDVDHRRVIVVRQ